jgi:5-methylcytosine-specific restriction endonuclease McrA
MNEELKELTQLCNKEIIKIKEKYKVLKEKVRNKYKNRKNGRKQHIPKKLKNMIWDRYVGKEKGIGYCYCCNEEIDSKNFEAGHIIPEARGGPTNAENLRPICSCCNKSMGIQNMDEFMAKYMSPKNEKKEEKKVTYYNYLQNNGYVDDRILINQILGYGSYKPKKKLSRYLMEY